MTDILFNLTSYSFYSISYSFLNFKIVMELDLGNLASVRTFASSLLAKFDHIDILVNNAGVYVPPEDEAKTKDGFEIHFGVNHLGHFLLTHLLLPRLQATPGSRWG